MTHKSSHYRRSSAILAATFGLITGFVTLMKSSFLSLIFISAAFATSSAQTSETNERLKSALEKFPAADADKNGILTLEEAKAFREKVRTNKESGPVNEAAASGDVKTLVYKNVGGTKLSLYLHAPKDHKADGKVPAIVFFHGGGWTNGTPQQFREQCRYLADRGMVAISAQYRLVSTPGVKIEDCVEDARSAMRWVRGHATELGIDPERIASGGGSAGGHLAACVELVDTLDEKSEDKAVSAKPNAMILFNPAMVTAKDPRLEKEMSALGSEENTTARLAAKARANPAAFSPLAFAKTKQPPCIMFFGTADRLLKPAQWFRDDSVASGNRCEIVTYEGEGHSFFNRQPYTGKTLAEVDKFLVDLGWLKKQ